MNFTFHNIADLESIQKLLINTPSHLFTKQLPLINDATIGQHVRHILEFYQQLVLEEASGKICYDNRVRNTSIETDPNFAIQVAQGLISKLTRLTKDKALLLRASYSGDEEEKEVINSSLKRELAYALDHSIHHLAIIKIALCGEGLNIDPKLGLAPSTLRFKNSTYQN
ncbi:MAG: hypothetical protein ACMVP2_15750 [Imperialibacter sp.]|uniref:hypothetical protein n=1 Tax=Imperialibacter sp. TaxID=2038411 RepID=UPI003A8A415E